MVNASRVIIALLFLMLVGIVWASVYTVIYVQQPAANPYVIATDGGTWNIILWLWGLDAVIIGLGVSIGLLSDGNMKPIIQVNATSFCVNLLLVILWVNLWVPMNVLIPSAFKQDPNISTYDNFFLFIMFGMDALALLAGGTVRIFSSSGGGQKYRRMPRSQKIIIREPRTTNYVSKYTYQKRSNEQVINNEGVTIKPIK